MRLRAMATLVRWLGPWEKDGVPAGVDRRELDLEGMRAYVYRGRRIEGLWVLAPGLHFLGPDDPRLDRFARILAASGRMVLAPFLPSHLALRVSERTTGDLAKATERGIAMARELGLPAPALFSISFGSQPAIAVAAMPELRDRVSSLVLFGGFADFTSSVRFCLTGRARDLSLPHDPLNAPVVWLHLLDHLDLPVNREHIAAAWNEIVRQTWGKMHLKAKGARDPIAHAIAATLPKEERDLFLMGCGLAPGGEAYLETALSRLGRAYDFTDPRPHLANVRAPVAIVHGRDDDVIPYFEAEKLRDALPPRHPHRVMLTGLYGHTGAAMPSLSALGRELQTMREIVGTLAAPESVRDG
ncbi:MAG: alpha/beta hydrolase family protein [Polyangiales bacterium]